MDDASADSTTQSRSAASAAMGNAAVNPGLTLPGPIRRWLKHWTERRVLKAAKARLALTAPHLLEDIGLEDTYNLPLRRRQHTAPLDETQDDKGLQDTLSLAAE
jgi:hypothetical protein